MLKKKLKIVEKLPRVQIGTIVNIFWSNGSYEKPSNSITRQEIKDNFIDVIAKINWADPDTGTITLEGSFNYLIFKETSFYFLNAIRIVDIKKQIFVYSVIKDLSMSIVSSPTITITGTLTKTVDEDTITDYLDFTKPLVEDFDENVAVPITASDTLVRKGGYYKLIDTKAFKKVTCFSSNKLSWILSHLTDPDTEKWLNYHIKQDKSTLKMLFSCEYDYFTPHKEILDHLNDWLSKANLVLGSVTDKKEFLKAYSCQNVFNKKFEKWKQIFILSEATPVTAEEDVVNMIKFTESKGRTVSVDYFETIDRIIPLDPDTLDDLILDNKHIFDIKCDEGSCEFRYRDDISNPYELCPRAYSKIATTNLRIRGYGSPLVHPPLVYNFSVDKLDETGHLDDEKTTENEDGKSIVSNIECTYFPDYWRADRWDYKTVNALSDTVLKAGGVYGFALFDIYNYWLLTRYTDPSKIYIHHNTGDTLFTLDIVTGLKFFDSNWKKDWIEDIAYLPETALCMTYPKSIGKACFTRSGGHFYLGEFTSSVMKNLKKNPFEIFNELTFSSLNDPFTGIYDITTQFTGTFAHRVVKSKKKSDDLLESIQLDLNKDGSMKTVGWAFDDKQRRFYFDLTNNPNFDVFSIVQDVKWRELLNLTWKNYHDARSKMTITTKIILPEPIYKGEIFWSNVSWVLYRKSIHQYYLPKKPIFAMLIAPHEAKGKTRFRFSKLTPYDISPQLSTADNFIVKGDERQLDKDNELYPWIIYEKPYELPAYEDDVVPHKEEHYKARKDGLISCIENLIWLINKYSRLGPDDMTAKMFEQYGAKDYAHSWKWSFFGGWTLIRKGGFLENSARRTLPTEHRTKGRYFNYDPNYMMGWYVKYIPQYEWKNNVIKYINQQYRSSYRIKLESHILDEFLNSTYDDTTCRQVPWFKSTSDDWCPQIRLNTIYGETIASIIFWQWNTGWHFYGFIVVFTKDLDKQVIHKWRDVENHFQDSIYVHRTYGEGAYGRRLRNLFSPPKPLAEAFHKLMKEAGWRTKFTTPDQEYAPGWREIYGNLPLTLQRIYENGYLIALRQDKMNVYYTNIDLKYIKDRYTSQEVAVFKLLAGHTNKGYLLMQWHEKEKRFLTQVILTDIKNLKARHENVTTPKAELITNQDLIQCINQKNYFYVYGQKIPIKAKLMKPNVETPFEIFVSTISADLPALVKYRVVINTPVENIDTKISVPKRVVNLGQNVVSYVDLEKLRIDISEREDNKALSLMSHEEKSRLLGVKLQNAKEELAFQRQIGPWNILGGALSGAARTSRFFNPESGLSYPNVAAGLLAASTVTNIITGKMQFDHDMKTGARDIAQMDMANAFTISHEKNMLDSKHKHEELRERMKIMEMNNNYTDTSSGEDDEEIKRSSALLFGDEDTSYGFIHYRPKKGGYLYNYIQSFYERYGIDIFVNNFSIKVEFINQAKFSIWKFDSITSINVTDQRQNEAIKSIFINGVRFSKTVYIFEHPKFSLDQTFAITKSVDERRKINEKKLLLQATSELDKEVKEAIRLSKEDVDKANKAYQALEEEKEKLQEECNNTIRELEETKDKLKTCEDQAVIEGLNKKIEQLKTQIEQLNNNIQAIQNTSDSCNQLVGQYVNQIAAYVLEGQKCDVVRKDNDDLKQKITALEKAKGKLEEAVSTEKATVTRMLDEKREAEKVLNTAKEDVKKLVGQLDQCKGVIEITKGRPGVVNPIMNAYTDLKIALNRYRVSYRLAWINFINKYNDHGHKAYYYVSGNINWPNSVGLWTSTHFLGFYFDSATDADLIVPTDSVFQHIKYPKEVNLINIFPAIPLLPYARDDISGRYGSLYYSNKYRGIGFQTIQWSVNLSDNNRIPVSDIKSRSICGRDVCYFYNSTQNYNNVYFHIDSQQEKDFVSSDGYKGRFDLIWIRSKDVWRQIKIVIEFLEKEENKHFFLILWGEEKYKDTIKDWQTVYW